MKLIVGLGNPGGKYNKTRHNLGFEVIEEFVKHKIPAESWSLNKKLKSEIVRYGDLILAKPQTYMNNSGQAVKLLADYFKIPVADLVVIHDELDLPLGKIKVRSGGAAAGHHGVESIIKALGDDKFVRVRLGIGNLRSLSGERKGIHFNAEHFVLETFMPNERAKVKHLTKQAIKALETLLEKGVEQAQNQFN